MKILVVHGPNLDRLGTREPDLYGVVSLAEIDERVRARAASLGVEVASVQSNHEGLLVDAVAAAPDRGMAGILINAAGLTHTSVILRDALVGTGLPFVEVHLSNPRAREPFRHVSLLADRALAVVEGFGALSYELALEGLVARLAHPPGGAGRIR